MLLSSYNATTLVIIFGIAVVLFFALREVNCWYWKINRHIELQEETNNLLQKLVDQSNKKETKAPETIGSTGITDLNDPNVMGQFMSKLGKKE